MALWWVFSCILHSLYLVKVPEVHKELFAWKVNPGIAYTEGSCKTELGGTATCWGCKHLVASSGRLKTHYWVLTRLICLGPSNVHELVEWDWAESNTSWHSQRRVKTLWSVLGRGHMGREGWAIPWGPLYPSWIQGEGAERPWTVLLWVFTPQSQLCLLLTPWAPFRGLGQDPGWLSQASTVVNPAALSPIQDTRSRQTSPLPDWYYQGKFFHVKKENFLSSVCMARWKQGGCVSAAGDGVWFWGCVNLGRRWHCSVWCGSRVSDHARHWWLSSPLGFSSSMSLMRCQIHSSHLQPGGQMRDAGGGIPAALYNGVHPPAMLEL